MQCYLALCLTLVNRECWGCPALVLWQVSIWKMSSCHPTSVTGILQVASDLSWFNHSTSLPSHSDWSSRVDAWSSQDQIRVFFDLETKEESLSPLVTNCPGFSGEFPRIQDFQHYIWESLRHTGNFDHQLERCESQTSCGKMEKIYREADLRKEGRECW